MHIPEGLKHPTVRVIAIAGIAILLLAIALWSVTRSKLGASSSTGPALAPNTPNGLNADSSGPTPQVIVLPPVVAPRPIINNIIDTPAPAPAPSTTPDPGSVAPPPPPPPAPAPTPVVSAPPPPAPVASSTYLGGQWYQVVSGDTLNKIAAKYGISTTQLATQNQSILDTWSGKTGTSSWNYIYPGEWLKIT